jgi:hypothetical protein
MDKYEDMLLNAMHDYVDARRIVGGVIYPTIRPDSMVRLAIRDQVEAMSKLLNLMASEIETLRNGDLIEPDLQQRNRERCQATQQPC